MALSQAAVLCRLGASHGSPADALVLPQPTHEGTGSAWVIPQAGVPPATPLLCQPFPAAQPWKRLQSKQKQKCNQRSGCTDQAIGSWWMLGMKLFFTREVLTILINKLLSRERLICSQLPQLGAPPRPGHRKGMAALGFFQANPVSKTCHS